MIATLFLVTACASFQPTDILDRAGLKLPVAVHVVAVGTFKGEITDRLKVDESVVWISGVQEQPEGDVGFVPRDTTYSSETATLTFDIKTSPASRGGRCRHTHDILYI